MRQSGFEEPIALQSRPRLRAASSAFKAPISSVMSEPSRQRCSKFWSSGCMSQNDRVMLISRARPELLKLDSFFPEFTKPTQ